MITKVLNRKICFGRIGYEFMSVYKKLDLFFVGIECRLVDEILCDKFPIVKRALRGFCLKNEVLHTTVNYTYDNSFYSSIASIC